MRRSIGRRIVPWWVTSMGRWIHGRFLSQAL